MHIIMKKLIIIIAFVLASIASACAQNNTATSKTGKQTEVLVPGYKLFPTTNMWIFLKLDTSQGLVRMVQYSMEEMWDADFAYSTLRLLTD